MKTLIIACLTAGAIAAQTTPSPALIVLSKTDRTLAVVDPATRAVVWKVPSGPDPHEVITSADGRTAYIANYGGGQFNMLTPVDLVERKALPPIDLGALRGPHGLAEAVGRIWFTAELAKVIGSYDPASRTVDLVVGTGQARTHMLDVSADGNHVITSNVNGATMSFIDKLGTGRAGVPPDWEETHVA